MLGRLRVGRLDPRRIEVVQAVPAPPEHADVRPVELVGGAGEEVAVEASHVGRNVRRRMDGVHEEERARGAGEGGGAGQIVDGPERVRRRAEGEEARARPDGALEISRVERPRLGPHRDEAHRHAALSLEGPPGVDVGVMVELRHDDLVPGSPPAAEGPREMERERRHVRAESDLVGRSLDEVRQRQTGGGDRLVGLLARRVEPVRVGVVAEEVFVHGRDDGPRDLRASRPVEIRDGPPRVPPLERREGSADRVDARSGGGGRGTRHGPGRIPHWSVRDPARAWRPASGSSREFGARRGRPAAEVSKRRAF